MSSNLAKPNSPPLSLLPAQPPVAPPTITTTCPDDALDQLEDEEPLIDQLLTSYRTHSPVTRDQYNFIGRHKNIDELLGNEVPPPAAPVTPQSSDDGRQPTIITCSTLFEVLKNYLLTYLWLRPERPYVR